MSSSSAKRLMDFGDRDMEVQVTMDAKVEDESVDEIEAKVG